MYKFIGALSYTIVIATGSFLVGSIGVMALEALNPIVRQRMIQVLQEIDDSEKLKKETDSSEE